jgi:hypothetical protein
MVRGAQVGGDAPMPVLRAALAAFVNEFADRILGHCCYTMLCDSWCDNFSAAENKKCLIP